LVPPSWSASKPGDGCRYVGSGASITLSFDPSLPSADFASIAFFEDGEVQFGSTRDAAAAVSLTAGPFVFAVAARPAKVTLYPQLPIQIFGVFEPFYSTPLEPEVQSATAIVAYPSSWKTEGGPKILAPRPWALKCTDLGLTSTKFAPTANPKGQGLGIDVGSFRLRATPGGPPVLELPPDSTVNVLQHNAHVAWVVFSASEGLYRGYEALSKLDPGSGSTSSSFSSRRPAPAKTTPCSESPRLYLVHADNRVMEVGRVKGGRAFQYEEAPFTVAAPDGPRTLVHVTSESVDVAPGFLLAVDAPAKDSCLPLPTGIPGTEKADASGR
jgi:hypothetical protein